MSELSIKHCSQCGTKTLINDSRIRTAKGAHLQRLARRRYCPNCGHKFSTVEIPQHEYDDLIRVKRMLQTLAKEVPAPVAVALPEISRRDMIKQIAEKKNASRKK